MIQDIPDLKLKKIAGVPSFWSIIHKNGDKEIGTIQRRFYRRTKPSWLFTPIDTKAYELGVDFFDTRHECLMAISDLYD